MSTAPQQLAAIQAGDLDAFGRWVAGAEPRLRLSLGSFASVVDTEAVVQDTLLKVWQLAPRFKPDGRPDALTRFAVRIARNQAISELRRNRVAATEIDALEAAAAEQSEAPPLPDPLLRSVILRCRRKLPPQPARALELRLSAHGGRPDHALAQAAQMSLNTFLQNVRRARLALAECLARQGVELGHLAPSRSAP